MKDMVGITYHSRAGRLGTRIIAWGRSGHLRRFPWRRKKTTPFQILISEVLLRRTTAQQVARIFPIMIHRYPNAAALTSAKPALLRILLRPLGLRSRSRELVRLAKKIVEIGGIPRSRQDLLILPGVGPYTAAAVRCFAWNLPEVLVDTNTVRIAARYFGLKFKADSHRDPRFRELIAEITFSLDPALINRSLLDLGATICRARKPDCFHCPIRTGCASIQAEVIFDGK